MEIQKSNETPDFGRCNYEFGIEYYVEGSDPGVAVIKILKTLNLQGDYQGWTGSAEEFLLQFVTGYHDVRSAPRSKYSLSRQMDSLPTICSKCPSQGRCYSYNQYKYHKNRPK